MPKGKGKSRSGKKSKGGGGRQRGDRWDQDQGKELVFENVCFKQFYHDLNILSPEDVEAMITQMKQQLATNFRLSALHPDLDALTERLETEFKEFEIPVEALEFRSPLFTNLKKFQEVYQAEQTKAAGGGAPARPMAAIAAECGLSGKTATIPLNRMKWYTPAPAYQFESSRRSLRRTPELQALHKLLVDETEAGNITRQEAVSMLPPLLLDVKPHHRVLDMCASPGSKTSQLLEALHDCEKQGEVPTGVVMANDNNPKRAYMLVHQCKRMTAQSLVVSVQDGQKIPAPSQVTARLERNCASSLDRYQSYLDRNDGVDAAAEADKAAAAAGGGGGEEVSSSSAAPPAAAVVSGDVFASLPRARDYPDSTECFDRVLADVPCSGDGTFRKNVELWPTWTPASTIGLHGIQVQIAARGLQLLRTGGRMVYSTCSMSPYEDEAVLGALLRWGKGSVRLVEVEDRLPGFKRRPGVSSWTTMDRHCNVFTAFDEIPKCMKEVDERRTAFRAKLRAKAIEIAKERGVNFEGIYDGVRLEDDDPRAVCMGLAKKALLAEIGDDIPRFPLLSNSEHTTPARPWDVSGCEGAPSRLVGKYLSHICSMPFSLFPPSAEEAAEWHLERTFRVVPQDNDTGGFFVALLERTGPLPEELPVPRTNREYLNSHQQRAAAMEAATGEGGPDEAEAPASAGGPAAGAKRAREDAAAASGAVEAASGAGASAAPTAAAGTEDDTGSSSDAEPADKKPRVDASTAGSGDSGAAAMDTGDQETEAAQTAAKKDDKKQSKKSARRQNQKPKVLTDEDIAALPPTPRFGSIIPVAWFQSEEARHALLQTIPEILYQALSARWGFDKTKLPREQLVVRNGNLGTVMWVTPESARLVVQPMEASVALSLDRSIRVRHDLKKTRQLVLAAIRRQTNIVICGVPVFEVKGGAVEAIADMAAGEGADQASILEMLENVSYRVVSAGAHLIEPALPRGPGSRCIRLSADDYAEILRRGTGAETSPTDELLSAGGRKAVEEAALGYGVIALDPALRNLNGQPTVTADAPDAVKRTALLLQVRTSIPCAIAEGQKVQTMVPASVVAQQGINLEILTRLVGGGAAEGGGAAGGGGGD